MKWANNLVVIVLALILAVETGFIIKLVMDQQQQTVRVLQGELDLQFAKNKNEELGNANGEIKGELEKANQQKTELTEAQGKLQEDANKLTAENEKLLLDQKNNLSKMEKLKVNVSDTTDKFMCDRTLSNVDFTNNESVNKSLKKYVTDTKGISDDVSASYWNLIWTGKKYSIHTVEVNSDEDNMNYIWKFTAYFRGESYGDHENGVFYNDDQCWMYLDK